MSNNPDARVNDSESDLHEYLPSCNPKTGILREFGEDFKIKGVEILNFFAELQNCSEAISLMERFQKQVNLVIDPHVSTLERVYQDVILKGRNNTPCPEPCSFVQETALKIEEVRGLSKDFSKEFGGLKFVAPAKKSKSVGPCEMAKRYFSGLSKNLITYGSKLNLFLRALQGLWLNFEKQAEAGFFRNEISRPFGNSNTDILIQSLVTTTLGIRTLWSTPGADFNIISMALPIGDDTVKELCCSIYRVIYKNRSKQELEFGYMALSYCNWPTDFGERPFDIFEKIYWEK